MSQARAASETNPPDVDRKVSFITAYAIQCGLCLIFIVLRFWARTMMGGLRQISWDDGVMFFTWVS